MLRKQLLRLGARSPHVVSINTFSAGTGRSGCKAALCGSGSLKELFPGHVRGYQRHSELSVPLSYRSIEGSLAVTSECHVSRYPVPPLLRWKQNTQQAEPSATHKYHSLTSAGCSILGGYSEAREKLLWPGPTITSHVRAGLAAEREFSTARIRTSTFLREANETRDVEKNGNVSSVALLGRKNYGQFCDPNVPKYNADKAEQKSGHSHESIDVVETAILANGLIFVAKMGAWVHTGSSAMLAEAVHSFADLLNQTLLVVGLSRASRKPDAMFQYGYNRERFVWSLISAVGIFCVGSGVTIVHGIHGIFHPEPVEHLHIAMLILGISLLLEGWSLLVAYKSVSAGAKRAGLSISEFARGGHDPTSIAVLAEDSAAVAGLVRSLANVGIDDFHVKL